MAKEGQVQNLVTEGGVLRAFRHHNDDKVEEMQKFPATTRRAIRGKKEWGVSLGGFTQARKRETTKTRCGPQTRNPEKAAGVGGCSGKGDKWDLLGKGGKVVYTGERGGG